MEWIVPLVLGLAVVVFVVPLISLVRASSARRQVTQNQDTWRKLIERVYALETQLKELRDRLAVQSAKLDKALADLRNAAAERPAPGVKETQKRPTGMAGPEQIEPPGPAVTVIPPPPEPTPVQGESAAVVPDSNAPLAMSPSATTPAAFPPTELPVKPPLAPSDVGPATAPRAEPHDAAKQALTMEEVLGADWLNKLGMIILVTGVALFLAYEMRALGPAGKVLVGFVVSGAMLAAGIFYERRERYRLLARVAIGGGWALSFFTTYALYHVPPARVLNSQVLDLVLLLAVTAAMVVHTLRYNSQVVTGMALLLGFLTVTISKSNVYSLSAGAILAIALVIIVLRRRWYQLEVCGILAGYLNHYYWLRPIIEPMRGGYHRSFPEFIPSAVLLIFYWLVFRISYVVRRIPDAAGPNGGRPTGERRSSLPTFPAEEKTSAVAALLNPFLLLGVMKYQSVHPDWAFRFLLLLGAVEFVLGQLPITRRRRAAFTILSVVGTTLVVVAIPFKYSGETLPILWLAEAEALFIAGIFLDEIVFCRLGLLESLLVAIQLNHIALGQIYDTEWKGFHGLERVRGAIEFAAASIIFYGNAHWLAQSSRALFESRVEKTALRVLSYAAGVTAVVGIWWLAPEPWVAVGLAALGLVHIVLGSRTKIREFTNQGHVVAALAFFRVLAVNLGDPSVHGQLVIRLATVGLTALMLYASARWSSLPQAISIRYVSSMHTWTASLLLALLAWYELKPLSVAAAWTLLGLALFEIGRSRRLPQLRLQAYLVFILSFMRLFFVNFNALASPGELSPRFYTTVPLALAFFYGYGALDAANDETFEPDRHWKSAEVLCFLGVFTLAGWARFELDADWVVAAWAAIIWVLVAIAWRYGKRIFLLQGLLLGAAVLLRATLHNFYERSYFPAPTWQSRTMTVGTTVALLFATLPFAFQLRRPGHEAGDENKGWMGVLKACERRPDQVFFFIPFFLLTTLLALEVPRGLVTMAWGMEAVAVFLLALALGQRSYRLSGLGLLLLCVGKIVVVDVWGLQPRDRYLTFIVLGVALLGVSFLYTRFRETIRQYL